MLIIRFQKLILTSWGLYSPTIVYCMLYQLLLGQLDTDMHFQVSNLSSYKTLNYIDLLHSYTKVKLCGFFLPFLCFQDKAQAKQAILAEQNRTSPFPTGVLTPPQSSKKQSSGLKPIWLQKLLTDNFAEVPVLLVLTPAPLWKCCQWSS